MSTYSVSPADRCLGMSLLSWTMAQGFQRSIAIRRRAFKPGQVGKEVQIEEVVTEWRAVRGLGRGAGTDCQDFVRARPVKRELGLEHLGVHTLADGGSRVVHPCPTTHSKFRCRTQCVGEGGVSAVNAINGEDIVCAKDIVCALLPVYNQMQ